MTILLKFCERCRTVKMSTERSHLPVPGLPLHGPCKCLFLCLPCRDEIIAGMNA